MSLALCLQGIKSQVPQHFRSSDTQATCTCQSVCSVHSKTPTCSGQEGWREVKYCHMPSWSFHSIKILYKYEACMEEDSESREKNF